MSDPRVRVVHCSPDTPAVTVALPRETHGSDTTRPIEYGQDTGYLVTPSGDVDVDVTPTTGADAPIVHTSHHVGDDEMWTLVVSGLSEENSIGLVDVEDEPAPSEQESAHVRFLNAIPNDRLEPLGFRFDEPIVDDDHLLSEGIGFGQHGTYRAVPPGRHQYHVGVETDEETAERSGTRRGGGFERHVSDDRSFDAGRAYTVVATGYGTANDFDLLVLEDTPTEATTT